jgi:hypothetical protein
MKALTRKKKSVGSALQPTMMTPEHLNISKQKPDTVYDPLTRGRFQSVFAARRDAGIGGNRRNRSHSVFVISEDEEIAVDLSDLIICEDNTAKQWCINRSRSVNKKELREQLSRKNMRTRQATVMVTTGALAFIVLAATLVTATFLMSPIIAELLGRFFSCISRSMK